MQQKAPPGKDGEFSENQAFLLWTRLSRLHMQNSEVPIHIS